MKDADLLPKLNSNPILKKNVSNAILVLVPEQKKNFHHFTIKTLKKVALYHSFLKGYCPSAGDKGQGFMHALPQNLAPEPS